MTQRRRKSVLALVAGAVFGLTLIVPPLAAEQPVPPPAATAATPKDAVGTLHQLQHISVEVVGEGGPDLILIPGLSTPRAVWDGLRASLAGKARLHLVQINGFDGRESPENAGDGLLDGVSGEIAAYALSSGLDQPTIMGHSLGGAVAMLSALDHPDRYGKVMVVDTLPFVTLLFDPGATVASAGPMADRIKAAMLAAPQGQVDPASLRGMALNPRAMDQIKLWVAASRKDVTAQAMSEMMRLDLRERLGSLRPPLTVIYPEPAAEIYNSLYATVPRHDLIGIADTGHFIMLDQPAAFDRAVETALGDAENAR